MSDQRRRAPVWITAHVSRGGGVFRVAASDATVRNGWLTVRADDRANCAGTYGPGDWAATRSQAVAQVKAHRAAYVAKLRAEVERVSTMSAAEMVDKPW